jgi:hypothetical protein
MKYTEKKVKSLSDKELLFLEHDNEVDLIHDLSFSTYLHNIYEWVNEEIKKKRFDKITKIK